MLLITTLDCVNNILFVIFLSFQTGKDDSLSQSRRCQSTKFSSCLTGNTAFHRTHFRFTKTTRYLVLSKTFPNNMGCTHIKKVHHSGIKITFVPIFYEMAKTLFRSSALFRRKEQDSRHVFFDIETLKYQHPLTSSLTELRGPIKLKDI